jgi:cation:H+ antiporter
MIPKVILLVVGVIVLYFGADWMVRGGAALGKNLGVSPMVVGLTVVSLGTSAPELFVSILATLRGSADIAVGNIMGSNLANIGLILGATALVRPVFVAERVVRREMPIMILVTLLLGPLLIDRQIGRLDGGFLVLLLVGYLTFVFYRGKKVPVALVSEYPRIAKVTEGVQEPKLLKDLALLGAGALGLLLGGRAIVESAIYLSQSFGISEMGVGLTVVAVGTSLPELATSIMAALRKETDIAVGNVIGSNIFNIAGVLGLTSIIKPIAVDPGVLWLQYPAVLALSFIALLVSLYPMLEGNFNIRRWEGAVLLASYVALGALIL